ncbi:colanic acid biosynthesis glycosyl transferase [Azospirillum melinis]|uniref:Colanic acid biosynthesis glycosyl transferase n=1 Tax=Azospirillum melinis TaxID=328839 RepID=A0ABX2KJN7_9PROT|nr:colanic acid biosynthesis glycosyl transferase [Azospirillum melinis]MBP2304336.1 putative colanic acid biosynthesis glycosyltransferase [Azospirillum melinis]NUB03349.1 colanic acid biosynthesis glycosyl transferase [Azospirillum melinis]
MTPPAPLRLAILTVVRNDCAGLADTYDSLRGELGPGIVWLVADGASTDGTAEWLAGHADVPLWWRSARDSGLYDAMNDALAAAGRLGCSHVLFLNAGDRLAELGSGMRLLQAIARHPDCALLYGDALERLGDGRILLKRARSHRWASLGMFTHHQAMIYSVSALAGLCFDSGYRIAADYDFTLSVLKRGRAERLHWPVCLFAAGGLSQRDATAGRHEQTAIRRRHFSHGAAHAAMIAMAQRVALALRHHLPALYAKLRFRCPEI